MVAWAVKTPRYPRHVPRGPVPHRPPTLRPSMSRADMLRETCPSDLEPVESSPPMRVPTAWVLFAPPLAICIFVVLLAALHSALGSPLGPAFAAEVWELAKMSIVPTLAATAFGAYVRRQNEDNVRRLVQSGAFDDPGESAAARPRVRQTGPYKTLPSGRHRAIEAEVVDEDEEIGPW